MNSTRKKSRLEERIHLAQEWKISGLTQIEFARQKGIEIGNLRYQIRYVRENAPESLNNFIPEENRFISVSPELFHVPDVCMKPISVPENPVLTIQAGSVRLSADNQINPALLRSALEVILDAQ